MAKDLTGNPQGRKHLAGQAGFSMIEMLMTAFVLAIGLLGLCMLETMSLRASRGSRSLSTAVHVANAVMDQVEMEGRLSWLNLTNTNMAGTSNLNLNLVYIPLPLNGEMKSTTTAALRFNLDGSVVNTASPQTELNNAFYTVSLKRMADCPAGAVGVASDYTVTVAFTDQVNGSNTGVPRQVVLSRRILHG